MVWWWLPNLYLWAEPLRWIPDELIQPLTGYLRGNVLNVPQYWAFVFCLSLHATVFVVIVGSNSVLPTVQAKPLSITIDSFICASCAVMFKMCSDFSHFYCLPLTPFSLIWYHHSLLIGPPCAPSVHYLHSGRSQIEARWRFWLSSILAQSFPGASHLMPSENQALPWPWSPTPSGSCYLFDLFPYYCPLLSLHDSHSDLWDTCSL